MARLPLWRAGLDFDHGVGHGVGSYLSVHEGPQRISKLGRGALEPGMILSNEPGYYREGAFGIRIENLVAVEPRAIPGGERDMLGFETLTLAPIDRARWTPNCSSRGKSLAQRLSRQSAQNALRPCSDAGERAWLKQATGGSELKTRPWPYIHGQGLGNRRAKRPIS